jgi:tryptophan-rich sensory protein
MIRFPLESRLTLSFVAILGHGSVLVILNSSSGSLCEGLLLVCAASIEVVIKVTVNSAKANFLIFYSLWVDCRSS